MNAKAFTFVLLLLFSLILAACNSAGGFEPTAGQSAMTTEQEIVKALTDYLEGQGAPVSQMNLEVTAIADDHARVEVISTDLAGPGGFNAFMKLEKGAWTTVVSGSGMEMEHVEALGIPQSVWPESWLSQASQPETQTQPSTAPSTDDCRAATVEAQTQSLVDEARGFCLLYPASHTVEQLDSGNTEIVLGSVMNHTDPRASIVTEELAGRSLEQAVDEFLADYEGLDIERSPLTVDGEAAIQLDRIPGQDFYRKVMVAHDGTLYQLSFLPYDPGLIDTFAQAEQIYHMVIDSFRFVSRAQAQTAGSAPNSSPPICPDLPRPAMVFQADNGQDYVLRHAASKSECTMQFDPPISRLLLVAADGLYYSTPGIGEGSTDLKIIHYANDGTLTEQPFDDAGSVRSLVISPDGTRVAWSQLRTAKTAKDEEMVVYELYTAKADGSDARLLHSVDNAAEVERGVPYIAWMIQPLRFMNNGDLLFTIGPDGRGGAWNAYTGRYNNLYQGSVSSGENELIYECPEDDYSSFCIADISPDGDYFSVTYRESGEITLFRMDGTPVIAYFGPGHDYTGFPTFSPEGDLVFMTADVAEDLITIERAYLSLVAKPYEKTAPTTLLREPLSFIWGWADAQHILYSPVDDGQAVSFSPSLVSLDGSVEPLPKTYGLFRGVQT